MVKTAYSPWPEFTEEEIMAVSAVLRSNRVNYWTGDQGRSFEREFAAWSGTGHAVALANGTVALDLALHGLRIGSANGGSASDEVIVTPRTFLASVSSVVNAGAIPVFADVDANTGNLSAETIVPAVCPRTRGVVVVHLAGWPADMDPIGRLAEDRGFDVIEDCAQAHGARYRGRSVGSIGKIGAWSFCQDKIMTTGGEGGMVTTDDRELWSRMWSFKDHGKSYEAVFERSHPPGYRWLHETFGTNWRMTEMQAAIGRIQLGRMKAWSKRRALIASRMRNALEGFSDVVRTPWPGEDVVHGFYRYYAYVRPEGLKPDWSRDRVLAEAVERGAPLYPGSCSEVYLEKAFDGTDLRPDVALPVARELGETSLMFLTHPTLTDAEIDRIGSIVRSVIADAAA